MDLANPSLHGRMELGGYSGRFSLARRNQVRPAIISRESGETKNCPTKMECECVLLYGLVKRKLQDFMYQLAFSMHSLPLICVH